MAANRRPQFRLLSRKVSGDTPAMGEKLGQGDAKVLRADALPQFRKGLANRGLSAELALLDESRDQRRGHRLAAGPKEPEVGCRDSLGPFRFSKAGSANRDDAVAVHDSAAKGR